MPLQHLDLYRLGDAGELYAMGFDDLLREPAATLVEWADRAPDALPADRLTIALEVTGAKSRKAALGAGGTRSRLLLDALKPRRRRRTSGAR